MVLYISPFFSKYPLHSRICYLLSFVSEFYSIFIVITDCFPFSIISFCHHYTDLIILTGDIFIPVVVSFLNIISPLISRFLKMLHSRIYCMYVYISGFSVKIFVTLLTALCRHLSGQIFVGGRKPVGSAS
jgi:hypothetical protein